MSIVFSIVAPFAVATTPYTGLTGSPEVNLSSDCCWENVSLSARGKRALVITTSHGEKLDNGDATGLVLQEAAAPYYVYKDAGMEVDIASIKGGDVPIGEVTVTPSTTRYKSDKELQSKFEKSLRIDDVNFANYDVVMMVGGLGAAFDLGTTPVLGMKVAAALEARTPLVGSVCHGVGGFYLANKTDGTRWLKGMTVTGTTLGQIEQLGDQDRLPAHPSIVLPAEGAIYESIGGNSSEGDLGAFAVVVDMQGPIVVTGQNQNAACSTAQRQLLFLTESVQPAVSPSNKSEIAVFV